MYLAFMLLSLSHVPSSAADRFEILGQEFKSKEIRGFTQSPDGKYLLGMEGSVGISNHVYLFHGKDAKEAVTPLINRAMPQCVDNKGGIIVNYLCSPHFPASVERVYRIDANTTRSIPVTFGDTSNARFHAEGVGPDGGIYGSAGGSAVTDGPDPRNQTAAVKWIGNQFQEFITEYGSPKAIGPTSGGTLGCVGKRGGGWLPVIFHLGMDPDYLPLPKGFNAGKPVASNADGSVILGSVGYGQTDGGTGMLWLKGVPYLLPLVGKRVMREEFTSMTQAGDLAVGLAYLNNGGHGPFVWTPTAGVQTLEDFAKQKNLAIPTGWFPISCEGVEPNGQFIFGTALGPNKVMRPFRLWLTQPST